MEEGGRWSREGGGGKLRGRDGERLKESRAAQVTRRQCCLSRSNFSTLSGSPCSHSPTTGTSFAAVSPSWRSCIQGHGRQRR